MQSGITDQGAGRKVLIVKDNVLNMKLFNDLLEAHGYTVFQAMDGREALRLARQHRPDLILMDIQLPEISGLEVTKRLRADEELRSIPVIAVTAFTRVGGWHAVVRGVDPAMLSLIRPAGDAGLPWPGLVLGIPVLGIYYWCTNQYMVQQTLSARSLDDGRRGALFAGLMKLSVLFLMILPGTCAILLFPHLARTDLVYPSLMMRLLPEGLLGLVAAGFVGSTMASVASTLNSASAIVTMDVVKRLVPGLSEHQIVRIGRRSMACLLVVAMLWAPQLEHFGTLWQYLQAMLAYAVPPIVALLLTGIFWGGANAAGAAATLVFGTAFGIALFVANVLLHVVHLHFLYVAPLLLFIDTAILVIVSSSSRAPASPMAATLVWRPAQYREETERLQAVPFWRNYRVQAVALLVLTAVVVFAFR